ncbi:MAG: tol-pal system-associated acyl-CoA thioesterase [Rhodospirillales bacterium RIFCSPLOWO2_12_FULL_58_28]|nr:MAG: tol-pal system-associated acyl-CoA thioesterase [Rhodospirillales bacterium RIFCSPLOWO2_02_FULL_58_16]OHC78533.1 MAG: tol-pal system-associated acyl-CoA thioesterase [Rhodospirillales bacterium RIFCSPLOWO2_12_FULL_58_28]
MNAHVFPVRVYYEDTDAGGIVYYANYLKFAERARTEMLRDLGAENSKIMKSDGIVMAVHHCSADYLKPARLDDMLAVHTRLVKIGGASLHLDQTVVRDGEDIARMKIRLVCMTLAGSSARLPENLRLLFNNYINNEQV